LQRYSLDSLSALLLKATPQERAQFKAILEAEEKAAEAEDHDAEIEKCKQWKVSHTCGPMYWLRKVTKTENYQWKEQGLPPVDHFPLKPIPGANVDLKALPFPHELTLDDPPDYLDIAMGYLLMTLPELLVPKTREMLTSWLVVGFITWFCQFYPKIEWVGQSEDDDKAQGLIKYANILYREQPDWLKARFPLKRGSAEGTLHRIEWAHGSLFIGVPSGTRKLASKHPHGYFNDETAHQEAAEETIDVARPAVKQIICVSSAAPSSFGDKCAMPAVAQ
jgi:hypothetical protein